MITAKRAKIVDFTQPFIESGLVVVAPVKTKDSDAWAFLSPLTPKMWCVTGVSIIILGAVIWVLEHRFNDEFRGPPQQQVKTLLWLVLTEFCMSYFLLVLELNPSAIMLPNAGSAVQLGSVLIVSVENITPVH